MSLDTVPIILVLILVWVSVYVSATVKMHKTHHKQLSVYESLEILNRNGFL